VDFDASPDKRDGEIVGKCKLCGKSCFVVSVPEMENSGGEWEPNIMGYNYRIQCNGCGVTRIASDSVEKAIARANFVCSAKDKRGEQSK
jgi:transcription elongation factor Elf1